jgi:hypothetical protein
VHNLAQGQTKDPCVSEHPRGCAFSSLRFKFMPNFRKSMSIEFLSRSLQTLVRSALASACCLVSLAQTSVLTQHNDLARTGQNLSETILTPANVSSGSFGKVFSLAVDGVVAAQPLYVPNLKVNGALHNVVFIATEHDSVFAFDADLGGTPLWQASLLDTAHGAAAGATSDSSSNSGCYTVNGEYGITGTPVIDSTTGTLYVVSDTYENNYPLQRLHALDITTGAEKFGGPTVINASTAGTGNGSSNGILNFDPKWELQRPGLLLVNGTVLRGLRGTLRSQQLPWMVLGLQCSHAGTNFCLSRVAQWHGQRNLDGCRRTGRGCREQCYPHLYNHW